MHRNIKLLAVFNFFTDFRLYSAVLVIYFARVTGSYTLAMSLFSVTMICAALFDVPTGIFSDKIGRKKTVVAGALAAVLYSLLYATGKSFWILGIGAMFEGLSRAFYSGNNDALLHNSLADTGHADFYAHYLGKVSAMFQAALVLGAVLGSIVANWSFTWVMWLSVIPQVACLIVSLFITEPKKREASQNALFSHVASSLSVIWRNEKLRLLTAAQILGFGVGESAFEFRSAFVATLWPTWAIGFSQMLSFVGGGISFWFSSTLIKKYKEMKLLLFEAIYNRIIDLIALIFPTVISPALMSTTSFLYGATEVSSNTLMQKEFTERERATLGSMVSFGGSLFFGMFSVIIGAVADRFSPLGALLFAEVCSMPRIWVLWRLSKKTNV